MAARREFTRESLAAGVRAATNGQCTAITARRELGPWYELVRDGLSGRPPRLRRRRSRGTRQCKSSLIFHARPPGREAGNRGRSSPSNPSSRSHTVPLGDTDPTLRTFPRPRGGLFRPMGTHGHPAGCRGKTLQALLSSMRWARSSSSSRRPGPVRARVRGDRDAGHVLLVPDAGRAHSSALTRE